MNNHTQFLKQMFLKRVPYQININLNLEGNVIKRCSKDIRCRCSKQEFQPTLSKANLRKNAKEEDYLRFYQSKSQSHSAAKSKVRGRDAKIEDASESTANKKVAVGTKIKHSIPAKQGSKMIPKFLTL